MDIAIVGATGNVGRKTLEVLEKKNLSIDKYYPFWDFLHFILNITFIIPRMINTYYFICKNTLRQER